ARSIIGSLEFARSSGPLRTIWYRSRNTRWRQTTWCVRLRQRGRYSTEQPTSSALTAWCRRSLPNTECKTRSSIRPSLRLMPGLPLTEKRRLPDLFNYIPPQAVHLLSSCFAGNLQARRLPRHLAPALGAGAAQRSL